VKLWNPETGDGLRTIGNIPQAVLSLSFSGDSHELAVGAWDGIVRLYDPANGRLIKQLPAPEMPMPK
jgi:WD40 repeat protein